MTTALHDLSIGEAAALFARRALSPVELVQAFLDRITAVDQQVASYLTVNAGAALAAAQRAERAIMAGEARGPLEGIPFAVKDNFYSKGLRTTAASRLMLDVVPGHSAAAIERLEQAGAILLGKLNMWEYGTGTGAVHFDLPFPPARNPWKLGCFTGGSSSGSGAAVAAGTAMAALGTDTGGSVRLPAAACGLQAIKPTFGRISRHGILPNCWSFDTPGPMAWTVRDCALLMDALAGFDARDAGSADVPPCATLGGLEDGVSGLRIGMVTNLTHGKEAVDAAILDNLERARAAFARAGALVTDMQLPLAPAEYRSVTSTINWAESFSIHETDFLTRRAEMGLALRDKLTTGFAVRAADYLAAQRQRRVLALQIDALFADVDLLLLPVSYRVAPPLTDPDAVQAFTTINATAAFNLSGHPAAAIRSGFTPDGLPTALQLVGRHFDEATVLRAAHAHETRMLDPVRRPVIPFAPGLKAAS